MPPDCGLADKQHSGLKAKKQRLTYLFTTNADGSTKLPPLIIRKYQKPRAFENKTGSQLGFYYRANAKAWMTASIYQEWLLDWDQKLRIEGRKILLLQDNFSGHVVPETLTNIQVVNFEPNLTAHVQPNDQGIIRSFKAYYRAKFIQRAVTRYECGTTPAQIYDINQLEAMKLAQAAWDEVDTTTVRNCWRKAKILPKSDSSQSAVAKPSLPISSLVHMNDTANSDNPVAHHAETILQTALDDLQSTGALQRSNRMNIAELLNPATETTNVFDATDEDIFQSVMDAKELGESTVTVGDEIGRAALEPRPLRMDVLQVVMMVKRDLAISEDSRDHKLEMLLDSYAQRTRAAGIRSTRESKLTDYFTRK